MSQDEQDLFGGMHNNQLIQILHLDTAQENIKKDLEVEDVLRTGKCKLCVLTVLLACLTSFYFVSSASSSSISLPSTSSPQSSSSLAVTTPLSSATSLQLSSPLPLKVAHFDNAAAEKLWNSLVAELSQCVCLA